MSKAENVVFFDAIFIMLLSAFGFTTGSGPSFSAFQSISQPTLAPLPSDAKCAVWDYVCNASKDIVKATAYIGWAIVNAPVLIIYFLVVTITFANIVLSIAFSPELSVKGVPYFGILFFSLQGYVIFEAIRIFRGSSTGV